MMNRARPTAIILNPYGVDVKDEGTMCNVLRGRDADNAIP